MDPLPAPAPPPRITVRHLVTIFAWAVVFLFFFYFISAFKLVLLGLLAATCLAALLRPILHRLPGPRPLKGFLLGLLPLFASAGLIIICVWWLVAPIQREFQYWPQTELRFNQWLAGVSAHLGLSPDNAITLRTLLTRASSFLGGHTFMQSVGGDFIDVSIGIVFVFVGTIYMLAEPAEDVIPAALDLLPPRRRAQARAAIDDLEPRLRWWLIGALITASIIGATSLLGFWLIGIKFFIPLAILAGISEFVPTIGPLMAFLLALAFAATQGVDKVLWLCGLYVLVHILESYILIPIIYKQAVRIPPVLTLFTVVLWGEIFGIGGLLLAVPINLVLWTAAQHFINSNPDAPPTPTT